MVQKISSAWLWRSGSAIPNSASSGLAQGLHQLGYRRQCLPWIYRANSNRIAIIALVLSIDWLANSSTYVYIFVIIGVLRTKQNFIYKRKCSHTLSDLIRFKPPLSESLFCNAVPKWRCLVCDVHSSPLALQILLKVCSSYDSRCSCTGELVTNCFNWCSHCVFAVWIL